MLLSSVVYDIVICVLSASVYSVNSGQQLLKYISLTHCHATITTYLL